MNRMSHLRADESDGSRGTGPGEVAATSLDPASAGRPKSGLTGSSLSIREVRAAIELVADTDTAVFITGESGTGKDVVARMIHESSPRRESPFVALNCAALPRDVIENELFGHEREAFTGATSRKIGCFEMAHPGTIFFDEIGEMPVDTQAKLLRAIESKSFRRLGGREEISVDVRVLAATNRDIPEALSRKELREDLYYRFSVIEICLPPLRDRREDIPELVAVMLAECRTRHRREVAAIAPEAMELLLGFDWPGNVRELKNVVERSVVITRGPEITPETLPARIRGAVPDRTRIVIPVGTSYVDAEKQIIQGTLAAVGHNKSEAARVLKISRRGLQKKIRRFEASTPAVGEGSGSLQEE